MRVFRHPKMEKSLLPQGGTFSANPVSMAAGRAAMEAMTPDVFDHLEAMGREIGARAEGKALQSATRASP